LPIVHFFCIHLFLSSFQASCCSKLLSSKLDPTLLKSISVSLMNLLILDFVFKNLGKFLHSPDKLQCASSSFPMVCHDDVTALVLPQSKLYSLTCQLAPLCALNAACLISIRIVNL
jgi:hypothetical protein